MKKALIVLLLLAFVVGSVFAQEGLTFSARVMAGLGFWKVGDDDPAWGILTPNGGSNGMRWNFIANYKNADGTKGVYTYLRSRGAGNGARQFNTMGSNGFHILYAEGWFTAFDGLLKVQGGRMTDSPFGYGDWWGMDDPTDAAFGLMATVNATDKIKFGAGGKGSNITAGDIESVTWFGGFRGDFGMVDARAYFAARRDNVEAHVAADIKLDGITIGLPAYIYGIYKYADNGEFQFFPYVSFSMVKNLAVNLFGHIRITSDDGEDAVVGGMLTVAYTINNIIPRIGIAFLSGGTYAGAADGLRENFWSGGDYYDKGDAYLLIRPAVRCRTSSSSYVDFGVVMTSQIGDNKPDNALSFGAFVDLSVSF